MNLGQGLTCCKRKKKIIRRKNVNIRLFKYNNMFVFV